MVYLLIIGIFLLIGIWYFFIRSPRPKIMPLVIDKDNPKMIDAIQNAKKSLNEFKAYLNKYPKQGNVKVPFLTSQGETEFLWGNVIELSENDLKVFLTTPPVTHKGRINRNVKYNLKDIVDWSIILPNEKIKGGFTMKVMFEIYIEKYGELPKILLNEEGKYE